MPSEIGRNALNAAQIVSQLASAAERQEVTEESLVAAFTKQGSPWPDTIAQLLAGKMIPLAIGGPGNAFPVLVNSTSMIETLALGKDKSVLLPPNHCVADSLKERLNCFSTIPGDVSVRRPSWYRLISIHSRIPLTIGNAVLWATEVSGCRHASLRELIHSEVLLNTLARSHTVFAAYETAALPAGDMWPHRLRNRIPCYVGKSSLLTIANDEELYHSKYLFLCTDNESGHPLEPQTKLGPVWIYEVN